MRDTIFSANNQMKVFICFAAEDRYNIAEPIAYNLKNYGIDIWYDRLNLLLGDNRIDKNIIDGAKNCEYAILIISKVTNKSKCAMEEIEIIKKRYSNKKVVVFPIIYNLKPEEIPTSLVWVKQLIFKEVTHRSGTREICNHIACKITSDILNNLSLKKLNDVIDNNLLNIPNEVDKLIYAYLGIDNENLNARVALLYATYICIVSSNQSANVRRIITKIFERIYSEARLCLEVDYRELWLLENSLCILINDMFLK